MYVEELPSGRWRGGFRAAGRKVSQTFDYEYEAAAWAAEAEARAARAADLGAGAGAGGEADQGAPSTVPARPAVVVVDHGPTIATHGQAWLNRRRGHLEPGTHNGYRLQLNAIDKTALGPARVGTLRRADVETWITAQVDAGTGRAAINARIKVLKMVLGDAADNGLAAANAAARIPYLKTNQGPDRVLDRDEEAAVLAAAPAELVGPILAGIDAGLRWQEVYALSARSVRASGFLDVSAAVVRHGGTKIKPYTKDGQSRVVPMATARLVDALTEAAKVARSRDGLDGLLFPNRRGRVTNYHTFRLELWLPTMAGSGIASPPGFHGLRHTYGSRLAAAGVPRSEIAKVMGHADEATTKRYIHAGDDGRRADLVRAALAAA